jgi:hypothetical protein
MAYYNAATSGNDGSTGFYPFPPATHTQPPGSPIGSAQGWSTWVMDGYPLTTPNMVGAPALRAKQLTVTVGTTTTTIPHGIADVTTGYVVLVAASAAVWPTQAVDATNIYLQSTVSGPVTVAVLY